MGTYLRHLGIWLAVTVGCALPSAYFAHGGAFATSRRFDVRGIAVGVGVVAVAYALLTSRPWFRQFRRRPFVERTIRFGFGTALALTILFPAGWVVHFAFGLVAIDAAKVLQFANAHGFAATLATTLIEAVFFNGALWLYMLLVYAIQRAVCTPPARKFEGACLNCGYDLRGSLETGRCPECGTAFRAPSEADTGGAATPSGLPQR